MKKRMITKMIVSLLLLLFMASCADKVKEEKIPVTTNSETALKFYKDAMIASDNIYLQEAQNLLKKAIKEDPDFFMAKFNLALFYKYFGNQEEFEKTVTMITDSEVELSDGEEILKQLIIAIHEDPDNNGVEYGLKLKELYPNDYYSYVYLNWLYMMDNNWQGSLEVCEEALEIVENKVPLYNALGYAYMNLDQMEKAEEALDKYLELAPPDSPNPYDSKGDLYMMMEDYAKAYDAFMKANEIDSTWSYKKAMKAKALLDSLGVE